MIRGAKNNVTMSKKIQLHIASPCQENWDNMTPADKGKFCASCQKQVVDFTSMSDRQIAEFFKKPATGTVCGRFMNDQLQRDIEIPKKRIPWVKYFLQVALPALFISNKAVAQGKVAATTVVQPLIKQDTVPLPGIIIKNNSTNKSTIKVGKVASAVSPVTIVKGQVVNESGEGVPYATLDAGGAAKSFVADENGFFEYKRNRLDDEMFVTVSAAGFESRRVTIAQNDSSLKIVLTPGPVLPAVTLTAYPATIKGRIAVAGAVTRITQTEITEKNSPSLTVTEPMFHVYPNPVAAGGGIHITFTKPEEGYYSYEIISITGQLVEGREIWIDADARLLNMEMPHVPAGTYLIALTDKKSGKRFTEKIIIR